MSRRFSAFLFIALQVTAPVAATFPLAVATMAAASFPASPAHASVKDDVHLWLRMRDSKQQYDFSTYARFLNARKDWPEQNAIRLRAEQALLRTGNDDAALKWFAAHPPVTDDASLRYIGTLIDNNRTTQAAQILREKWRGGAFNEAQQQIIRANYFAYLTAADHEERLSTLIWNGRLDRAERALDYVTNAALRQAGTARIALQRGSSRALSLMTNLPEKARTDNGVIYDLARYYRQKGQDTKAIEILSRRRQDIRSNAPQWWRERSLLARRAMESGRYAQAYQLLSSHGHLSGIELAEAEWLAGWLALTRLKKPTAAYNHFDHMYRNVKSPISVARAAYWAGIAAGQMGERDRATQWYTMAARHMNTFYGQMAAYALGQPKEKFAAFFSRSQNVPTTIDSRLRSDLVEAARLLNTMKKPRERDMFLRAVLRNAQDLNMPHLAIPLARQLGHHGVALAAAKSAYDKDILVADALFPRTDVPKNAQVDTALTLSIIRQESMFDPLATSTANARGLMQVLPTTASHIAKREGLSHKNGEQLYQPRHNMVIGQAYLAHLLRKYDGFVPLASAAYNAGPGNVDKWLDQMGDPRKDPYSWVDWAERIPFYETRNYVQRVWENYTAYKYLLNK